MKKMLFPFLGTAAIGEKVILCPSSSARPLAINHGGPGPGGQHNMVDTALHGPTCTSKKRGRQRATALPKPWGRESQWEPCPCRPGMAEGEGPSPSGSPAGNGWPVLATLAALQLSQQQGLSSPEMIRPKDVSRCFHCCGFVIC